MIIQVASEVRVVHDGTSWTVQRLGVANKKTGERDWQTIGYYGWLSQAVRAILERHIQLLDGKSNQVDLASLGELVLAATIQIEDACEKLGKAGLVVPRASENLAQVVKA